jgi:hypothetical protein
VSISSATSPFSRRVALLAGALAPLLTTSDIAATQVASPTTDITADMIRDLERTRLRALVDFDKETADLLHADDFQLINPAGVALSKADYLGDLEAGVVNYSVFEPNAEIEVHLSPGSAVIRYQSDLALTLAGTEIPLSNYWHTDYYEERGGQWQVVWSQATEILD